MMCFIPLFLIPSETHLSLKKYPDLHLQRLIPRWGYLVLSENMFLTVQGILCTPTRDGLTGH